MECSSPVRLPSPDGEGFIYVRCGRCYECLQARAQAWVMRLLFERSAWTDTYFFTLTYDPENVPTDIYGRLVVSKDHIKKFVADLRKRFQQGFFYYKGVKFELPQDERFRYYITSEYGSAENTHRPHYHGVLYINYSDCDSLLLLFTAIWNKGFVQFDPAGERAAGYVSKYLVKYQLFNDEGEVYEDTEDGPIFRPPISRTFSLMSKGLAKSYFTAERLSWHRADPSNRGFIPGPGGIKLPMPRYFTNIVFDDDMKLQRLESFKESERCRQEVFSSLSPDEMKARIQEEDFAHEERVRQAKHHYTKSSKL